MSQRFSAAFARRAPAALACAAALLAAASAPAAAQELIVFDRPAITALASNTSPQKITARQLLQAGGDTVAMRISLPPNTDIPPHSQPAGKVAIVTVIAGELGVGLGTTFNAAALRPLVPGDMIVLRDTDPLHFARTGNNPVELLLMGVPRASVAPALLK